MDVFTLFIGLFNTGLNLHIAHALAKPYSTYGPPRMYYYNVRVTADLLYQWPITRRCFPNN